MPRSYPPMTAAAGAGTTTLEYVFALGFSLGGGPDYMGPPSRRVSGVGNVTLSEPTPLTYGGTASFGGGSRRSRRGCLGTERAGGS
jgi:hypothetical protein